MNRICLKYWLRKVLDVEREEVSEKESGVDLYTLRTDVARRLLTTSEQKATCFFEAFSVAKAKQIEVRVRRSGREREREASSLKRKDSDGDEEGELES